MSADTSLIICELWLPDMSGIHVLRELRRRSNMSPFVMMTASGSIQSAVEAVRIGAAGYVSKVSTDEVLAAITPWILSPHQQQIQTSSRVHIRDGVHRDPNYHATQALLAIERRFTDHSLTLHKIAMECGISTEHICRLIITHTGCGFALHLHRRRLDKACHMLLHTTFSIKEIAHQVGYNSPSRLAAHFIKAYGLTPLTYRRLRRPAGQTESQP
jgi:AraC-like DNA-binding protein